MEEKRKSLPILICRQPGGSCVEIDTSEISNPKWDNKSGGYRQKRGGYSLYGYIPYSRAVELGEEGLDCSGTHEYFDDIAKVCICKVSRSDKHYKGYTLLLKMAGDKPKSIISINRPQGEPPCTKKILMLLSDKEMERGNLRDVLLDTGYKANTILGAINRLKRAHKIVLDGSSNSRKQKIRITRDAQEI